MRVAEPGCLPKRFFPTDQRSLVWMSLPMLMRAGQKAPGSAFQGTAGDILTLPFPASCFDKNDLGHRAGVYCRWAEGCQGAVPGDPYGWSHRSSNPEQPESLGNPPEGRGSKGAHFVPKGNLSLPRGVGLIGSRTRDNPHGGPF